jgi:hypothetical protein
MIKRLNSAPGGGATVNFWRMMPAGVSLSIEGGQIKLVLARRPRCPREQFHPDRPSPSVASVTSVRCLLSSA